MANNFYYNRKYFRAPLANAGATNIAVNGSVTPVNFTYAPAATNVIELAKFEITLTTSGIINRLSDRFLDLNPALINGIDIGYVNDSVETIITNLKSNADLLILLGGESIDDIVMTRDAIRIALDFANDKSLVLDGNLGDSFFVRIRDNLSSLSTSGAYISGGRFNG